MKTNSQHTNSRNFVFLCSVDKSHHTNKKEEKTFSKVFLFGVGRVVCTSIPAPEIQHFVAKYIFIYKYNVDVS
jgi:hypothetical protein